MITLYGYRSINTFKILMLLYETKQEFKFIPINIRKGEQREPAFLALNPVGRVPVLVDGDLTLTESNAILLYLTQKLSWGLENRPGYIETVTAWLFYQASTQGPFFGQVEYWTQFAKTPNPEALAHYKSIAHKTIALLDSYLSKTPFLCGDTFSIVDIAHFAWIDEHAELGLTLDDAPHTKRWWTEVAARQSASQARDFIAETLGSRPT